MRTERLLGAKLAAVGDARSYTSAQEFATDVLKLLIHFDETDSE